jgi:hypothetical protein
VSIGTLGSSDGHRAFELPVHLMLLQGHTKDVDTALVTTSEVTDYPMILLMGIGYVSGSRTCFNS